MALYESVFIMRQDIPAQEAIKQADKFNELIKKFGGKLVKQEYWGLRHLAYPVKKNKKGHYILLCIDTSSSEVIPELERNYKINEDVIRFRNFKVDKFEEGPTAMMQAPDDVNEN
jgi:small subunit ribosomal protein S6